VATGREVLHKSLIVWLAFIVHHDDDDLHVRRNDL
jgi:hypothetical protein